MEQREEVVRFTTQRESAFADELAHWKATGQLTVDTHEPAITDVQTDWPEDHIVIESPVAGSVWQYCVEPGDIVETNQPLLILESMKMEIPVLASERAQIVEILSEANQAVRSGQALVVLIRK